MKTRFTLTALALTSALAFSTSAMAAEKTDYFHVHIKLTGTCEVLTTSSALGSSRISTEDPNLAGADIDFGEHTASSSSSEITQTNKGGIANGIQVNCSKNTPFTVALDPQNVVSTNGQGTMFGLKSPTNTDTIRYQLQKPVVNGSGVGESIQETNSGNPWGSAGNNVLSLTGQGLNTPIKLPVFAKISAGELDKYIDTYQDQVKVTLAY